MPFEQEKDAYPPQDAVLRSVVEGVEAETGEQFFYSLVRSMACALGVQYAFVSEWFMEQGRARTRAVWGRGKYHEKYEINLAPGMPCQVALSGRIAHHAARVSFLFPGQPVCSTRDGLRVIADCLCLTPPEGCLATSRSWMITRCRIRPARLR